MVLTDHLQHFTEDISPKLMFPSARVRDFTMSTRCCCIFRANSSPSITESGESANAQSLVFPHGTPSNSAIARKKVEEVAPVGRVELRHQTGVDKDELRPVALGLELFEFALPGTVVSTVRSQAGTDLCCAVFLV
jgi:hypothetical protein